MSSHCVAEIRVLGKTWRKFTRFRTGHSASGIEGVGNMGPLAFLSARLGYTASQYFFGPAIANCPTNILRQQVVGSLLHLCSAKS